MSVSEDIVNGLQCSWCGTVFQGEHGYPVLCHDCYDECTEEDRNGLQRATIEEI